MTLPIIEDEIEIDEDGNIVAWACAVRDLGIAQPKLRECAAPRGDCPRGFTKHFECKGD